MRTLRNAQHLPSTHWTQWNTGTEFYPDDIACTQGVGSMFQFLEYHQVWEHPAVSELAKHSRPTESDIDYDSDIFLTELLKNLWLPDIIARQEDDDISAELFALATTAHTADMETRKARQEYEQSFNENAEIIQQEEAAAPAISKDATFFEKLEEPSQTAKRLVDEYIDIYNKQTDIFNSVFQDILIEMVKTGYSPLPDNTYSYGVKLSHSDEFDSFGAEYFYQVSVQYKLYHLNIASYPGENLPLYVHDQLVYMNYMQHRVQHENPDEADIAQEFKLLSDDFEEVLTAFKTAILGVHGWWT